MQLIFNKVTRTIQYDKKQIYQLNLGADSAEVETIKSTANHPFYVKGEGFVRVDQLKQTDQLIDAYHNNRLVIQKIAKTNQFSEVNDLTVESSHTYFIGRAGAWVHNSGGNNPEARWASYKKRYKAYSQGVDENGYRLEPMQAILELDSLSNELGMFGEKVDRDLGIQDHHGDSSSSRLLDDENAVNAALGGTLLYGDFKTEALGAVEQAKNAIQGGYYSQQITMPLAYLSIDLTDIVIAGIFQDHALSVLEYYRSHLQSSHSWGQYFFSRKTFLVKPTNFADFIEKNISSYGLSPSLNKLQDTYQL